MTGSGATSCGLPIREKLETEAKGRNEIWGTRKTSEKKGGKQKKVKLETHPLPDLPATLAMWLKQGPDELGQR